MGRLPRRALWIAATRRLAVCTIRLPANSGDFEATGLISTAKSNPPRWTA
jgi:hypothetical protein